MEILRESLTNEQLDTIIHGIYGLASRLDDMEIRLGRALEILQKLDPSPSGIIYPSSNQGDLGIDPFTAKNTDDDNLGIF